MIDFDTVAHLTAMWFVGNETGDWMGVVYREKISGDWVLAYRWRYCEGKQVGDPFKDQDRKSWYEGRSPDEPGIEAKLSGMMDFVADLNALRYGEKVDRMDVGGPPELFAQKAAGRTWIHFRTDTEPVLTSEKRSAT
jgi:hypothetical protein